MTKVCGRRHRRKADPSSSFAPLQNTRPSSQRGEALDVQSAQEHREDTAVSAALSKPENVWPGGPRELSCASRFLKDCLGFFCY